MRRLAMTAAVSVTMIGLAAAPAAAQGSPTPSAASQVERVQQLLWGNSNGFGLRGRLLEARPLHSAAVLPSAAANYFVKYTSVGARGQLIVVSGTVAIPRQEAPRHGWPVISWAHGTTGTADVCAPSRDTANGLAHDYLGAMHPTLDRWVANGFVVVQTDYEGLGTPGPHPYVNGTSEANTLVDIVRAARQVNRAVGRSWFAVGHSQGGQAALFAAAAPRGPQDVRLRGAIALAPGGTGISQTVPFFLTNQPGAQQSMGFLATILVGAAAADPAVQPRALLTDKGETLLDVAATQCQPQLNVAGLSVPPTEAFEPGADFAPLTAYLRQQEPEHLTIRTPTLVLQGTDDVLVPKPTTDFLVSELRKRSDLVQYKVYQGADHRGVVSASFEDQLAFVRSHLP